MHALVVLLEWTLGLLLASLAPIGGWALFAWLGGIFWGGTALLNEHAIAKEAQQED